MASDAPDPQLVQAAIRSYERTTDLQYVQLLLAICIVILVLYFVGCYFGAVPGVRPMAPAPSPAPSVTPAAVPAAPTAPAREAFAPYASILTPDIERSDAQFDHSDRTVFPRDFDQRNSENLLFNNIHSTQLLTPLY